MTVTTAEAPPRESVSSLPMWAAGAMAGASAVLLAQAHSLHPQWWAAWAAPAPLIAAVLAGPPGRTRWLGAIAGLGAGLGAFAYTASVAGLPLAVIVLAGRCLFWSAFAGLTARAVRTLPTWLAPMAAAAFAAGVDTLVLTISPHGTYGSLAYSQMDALPVIQAAALGGPPAIIFLVLSGATTTGLCVARLMGASVDGRRLRLAAMVTGVLVAGMLAWGEIRLAADEGPKITVSLIAGDKFAGEPRDWRMVWSAYGPAAEAAARPGAVVVLPEKIALLTDREALAAGKEIAALARARATTVVVGIEVHAGADYANRALVATPDGRVQTYDKRRPVPGREARDRPGQSLLRLRIGAAEAALAICKDMHFPGIGRENGLTGAGLMLVPAWDFVRDGWMSDRVTALRGVESGFSIARSTREGISSVSDRFGRVLAERTSAGPIATLTAEAPATSVATPYRTVGDAFGWLCVGVSGLLMAALRRRR
jgi:apolipoprotein N-acyltransferase